MNTKKTFILLISALVVIFIIAGCSEEKDQEVPSKKVAKDIHGLYDKVQKETKENAARAGQNESENQTVRKRQTAVADACLNRYNSCLEKCTDSPCENACQNALSVCEKNLPPDLKTIKDR